MAEHLFPSYGRSIDVWVLGISTLEMIMDGGYSWNRFRPCKHPRAKEIRDADKRGFVTLERFPEDHDVFLNRLSNVYSDDQKGTLVHLCSWMTAFEPKDRISPKEIVGATDEIVAGKSAPEDKHDRAWKFGKPCLQAISEAEPAIFLAIKLLQSLFSPQYQKLQTSLFLSNAPPNARLANFNAGTTLDIRGPPWQRPQKKRRRKRGVDEDPELQSSKRSRIDQSPQAQSSLDNSRHDRSVSEHLADDTEEVHERPVKRVRFVKRSNPHHGAFGSGVCRVSAAARSRARSSTLRPSLRGPVHSTSAVYPPSQQIAEDYAAAERSLLAVNGPPPSAALAVARVVARRLSVASVPPPRLPLAPLPDTSPLPPAPPTKLLKSKKFLPALLDAKFPCKAFESLKLPKDLRESTVLDKTINNKQPHELAGADMSYTFLVDADPEQTTQRPSLPLLAYCVISAEYEVTDSNDCLSALLAMGTSPYDIPQDMWYEYINTQSKGLCIC
ncbi:MAG: hypothetical protein LQ350_006742 [Teloschistes chrysophthalmus]|nr:MAG: hypothetical protein LQ350_006742 [Niorma chrysophthalma]